MNGITQLQPAVIIEGVSKKHQLLTKLLISLMILLPSFQFSSALGVLYEVWHLAHFPGGTDPG